MQKNNYLDLDPTLINRVNKLMTNNIRSTYNCYTFWSHQEKTIKPYVYRVNIWGYFDSVPKNRVNLVEVKVTNLFKIENPFVIKL